MAKVIITIRAYNKEGYQRDIVRMDENQVHMMDTRVDKGITAPASIDPKKFPEMDRFEIIVQKFER